MKRSRLNMYGFTHQLVLLAVVVIAVIGGVFVLVLRAHHNQSSKSSLTTSSGTSTTGTLNSNAQSQSTVASTTQTSNSNAAAATNTSKSSSTSKSTTTSNSQSGGSSTPAPASQTPLSVLTTLITNLDNGALVNVTASAVGVPGPISTAQARPIVFTANGQVYFAYKQGSAPNFATTPAETANSMAIVNATVSNPSLVQAHLDKAANLVDPNSSANLVGYSTGGN